MQPGAKQQAVCQRQALRVAGQGHRALDPLKGGLELGAFLVDAGDIVVQAHQILDR